MGKGKKIWTRWHILRMLVDSRKGVKLPLTLGTKVAVFVQKFVGEIGGVNNFVNSIFIHSRFTPSWFQVYKHWGNFWRYDHSLDCSRGVSRGSWVCLCYTTSCVSFHFAFSSLATGQSGEAYHSQAVIVGEFFLTITAAMNRLHLLTIYRTGIAGQERRTGWRSIELTSWSTARAQMNSFHIERDEDTATGIAPFVVGCVLAVLIEAMDAKYLLQRRHS